MTILYCYDWCYDITSLCCYMLRCCYSAI